MVGEGAPQAQARGIVDAKRLLDRISPDLRLKIAIEQAVKRKLPLPAVIRAQIFGELAGQRGITTLNTFQEFVQTVNPSLLQFEHVHKAIPTCERIITGELSRVLVLWPTQYHKSEIFSRLLPACFLLKHPSRKVALASYNADLAWTLSGEARDNYAAAGGKFRNDSSGAKRYWETGRVRGQPGGMMATSVGGRMLGFGFHLGIVDDPVDPQQAKSRIYQRRFAQWWSSKWLRGGRATGQIVFVMQRLAMDDPVAWILKQEEELGEHAHKWHILAFDEVKSDEPFGRWTGPRGFPSTCTVEPDDRKKGEVLSPKWYPADKVKQIQARMSPLDVAAMRQQRPMLPTGDFWLLKWFEKNTYSTLPSDAHNGGWDWDTAYTKEEENSATAGVKSYRSPGNKDTRKVYIDDVDWDWLEFPQLIEWLKNRQGPHHVEKKASGKSVVQALLAYNVRAEEVPVIGDKLARASAAQPAVQNNRVYVHERVLKKLLYGDGQGLLTVTAEALQLGGEGLDLNDAFVQAIWRQLEINIEPKRKAAFG